MYLLSFVFYIIFNFRVTRLFPLMSIALIKRGNVTQANNVIITHQSMNTFRHKTSTSSSELRGVIITLIRSNEKSIDRSCYQYDSLIHSCFYIQQQNQFQRIEVVV